MRSEQPAEGRTDWVLATVAALLTFAMLRSAEDAGSAARAVLVSSPLAATITVGAGVMFAAGITLAVPRTAGGPSVLDRLPSLPGKVSTALLAGSLIVVAVLGTSSRSTDSTILVATNSFLRSGNLHWLLESQEAPLPHLFIGLLTATGFSYDRLVIIPIIGSIALILWVGQFVQRRHESSQLAVLAMLALAGTQVVTAHFNRLPMYPWFAVFGTIALIELIRYTTGGSGWTSVAVGGAGIALAVASHGAGLYFAPMAACTAVFIQSRVSALRWAKAMLVVFAWNVPWLVSRFWVNGIARLPTPRDTWVINQGYLLDVNRDYWGYAVGSRTSSLLSQPGVFNSAFGQLTIPLVVLALVGLRRHSKRTTAFCVLGILMLVAPLTLTRSAGFERYYFALAPALVLLAAEGLAVLGRGLIESKRGFLGLTAILSLRLATSFTPLIEANLEQQDRVNELRVAANLIEPGDAVIGYRSMALSIANPNVLSLHQDLVSEDTYRVLYAWEPTGLLELGEQRSVEWVLLTKPFERTESAYTDTWFAPSYGFGSSYVQQLTASNCAEFDGQFITMFRLADCISP